MNPLQEVTAKSSAHGLPFQKEDKALWKKVALLGLFLLAVYVDEKKIPLPAMHILKPATELFLLGIFLVSCLPKQRVKQPVETQKEVAVEKVDLAQLPEHVGWEELAFLMTSEFSLGFRHAGTWEQAVMQKEQGFLGDALNLDVTVDKTWKLLMPGDVADKSGWTERERMLLWPDKVSEMTKQKMIQFWEEGVLQFICQPWVDSRSTFLLVDFGANQKHGVYDFSYGKGLGKFGKQKAAAHQVIAFIPPPPEKLEGKALTKYFRSVLIKKIHEYKQKMSH